MIWLAQGTIYPDIIESGKTLKEHISETDKRNIALKENYSEHPDYQSLPESIKTMYTQKEYAWLDDESRENLIKDMTLPEVAED